jgi:Sap, sulfolipid-1-addressing protein
MGPILGDILPAAIGVAISPIPIIAVILMLFTASARTNGPAFLAGWVLALFVVGTIGIFLTDRASSSGGSSPSTLLELILTALGVLLLLLALRSWRGRPRAGETPPMPAWMASIDGFTAGKAFGFAVLLGGVNPKNLLLTLSAAAVIGTSGLGTTESFGALLCFVAIGSLSVAVPVVYFLVGGDGAKRRMDGWKAWLGANNATVMTILLLVIGAKLLGQGLGGLIG